MTWNNNYNGEIFTDPQEELKARSIRAEQAGDRYLAIPLNLARALYVKAKICEARTVVNGDRFSKTLIEIRCTRELDPITGKHRGVPHTNGKTTWD